MNGLDFADIAQAARGSTDAQTTIAKIRFASAPEGTLRAALAEAAKRPLAYQDGFARALEKAIARSWP